MACEFLLLGTDHCTLCEEALELLLSMPELAGHSVSVVDVAEDEGLVARYGERLPVLQVVTETRVVELDWPFAAREIVDAAV
ncbi:MAG: glutaredoxin family protein [Pseudomonadales bacterium]